MLPKNLVYVRHGQSTRNEAGKVAFETGDMALFEEVVKKPSAVAPLTKLGREQAVATGEWLRKQDFAFRRVYTSSFNRAKETAGLINMPSKWYIENLIRERTSGVMEDMSPTERTKYLEGIRNRAHTFDAFNFRPDRGESYADIASRKTEFFSTLHRECANDDILVVNHGDNMWVVDYKLHRWTPEEFVEIRGDGRGKIPNCAVVHYTRIDPETGRESPHVNWKRVTCPWKDPTPGPWQRIIRKGYTSQDLLDQVEASLKRCDIRRAS